MKAVLISIKPKWVEKIASGEKTIEVRKTRPKIETPFKVYIYCTIGKYKDLFAYGDFIYQNRMKVIGEFVCDRVDKYKFNWAEFTAYGNKTYLISEKQLKNTCLSREEFNAYGCTEIGHKEKLYGWHISDLVIYDKPKELSEFRTPEWFRNCEKKCPDVERMRCPTKDSHKVDKICGWCRGGGKPLTRPPQSWCYVEDKDGNI